MTLREPGTPPWWWGVWADEPPAFDGRVFVSGSATGAAPFAHIDGACTDPDAPHGLLLAELAAEVAEVLRGGTALEVGLHRSGWLAWLERRGLRTVGVDASGAWVRHQAERARARGSDALLLQADVGALPVADDTFSLVLALDVLEHLAEPGPAIAELARVLLADGRVVVHVPTASLAGSWEGRWARRHPEDYAAVQTAIGHDRDRILDAAGWLALLEAELEVLTARRLTRWLAPLHDYRWLPALGRLRRAGGAAATETPRGRDRYARWVIPPLRRLAAAEERLLPEVGSSLLVVARRRP